MDSKGHWWVLRWKWMTRYWKLEERWSLLYKMAKSVAGFQCCESWLPKVQLLWAWCGQLWVQQGTKGVAISPTSQRMGHQSRDLAREVPAEWGHCTESPLSNGLPWDARSSDLPVCNFCSWVMWCGLTRPSNVGRDAWSLGNSRMRRGKQRMRQLDGFTDSMDTSLSKLRERWRTGKSGVLQSMELQTVRHELATEQEQQWNE